MSIAAQIFSEQDWPKFHKDLLIKGLSDDKIESYCNYMLTEFDSGFNGHLRECQREVDLRDNFSRIASVSRASQVQFSAGWIRQHSRRAVARSHTVRFRGMGTE